MLPMRAWAAATQFMKEIRRKSVQRILTILGEPDVTYEFAKNRGKAKGIKAWAEWAK